MEFLSQNMQVIVASLVVLALLLVVMLTWRAVSPRMAGRRGQRLGISEYHEIDKSRRLVLVRRDNVEHLILIGGAHDLVIEQSITPAAIAAAYTPSPISPDPSGFRPAPRAPSFNDRHQSGARPPQLRSADTMQQTASREEPSV